MGLAVEQNFKDTHIPWMVAMLGTCVLPGCISIAMRCWDDIERHTLLKYNILLWFVIFAAYLWCQFTVTL